MMDVLCLLHIVYYSRHMGDYMVPAMSLPGYQAPCYRTLNK